MGERKKRHIHNQVASCGYVNYLERSEHSFWGKYAEFCEAFIFFIAFF